MAKRSCKQCGRDTNGTYCWSCSPHLHGNNRHDEQRIRRGDEIETHDDDLLLDEYAGDAHPPVKVDPYHGSTSRDDI